MSEAARHDQIVDMAQYLRDTLAEMDDGIAEMQRRRAGVAFRLAAIEAATDPDVLAAVADYESRVTEGRPYENTRDAEDVVNEAAKRYGPQPQ